MDVIDFGHVVHLAQGSWEQHIRVVNQKIQPCRAYHRFPDMKLPRQRSIGFRYIYNTTAASFAVLQFDGLVYIPLTLFFLTQNMS